MTLLLALISCTSPHVETAPPDTEAPADDTQDTRDTSVEHGGASDALFDPARVHTIHVTADESDWAAIQRNPERERYIRVTVEMGDVRVDDVGMRFKGSWGSLFWCADGTFDCDKLNLKFDFHEYVDAQRFYDVKKLNLHAMEVDDSNVREHLAYTVWRGAQVPASRTGWTTLRVNDQDMGLFLLVEQVDGRFTRHRWDHGDGDLYKETWFTETSTAAWAAGLQNNAESGTPERMAQMAQELDADFETALDAWMDRDALVRFLAAMDVTGSFDGVAAFYCVGGGRCDNHNYFVYDRGDQVLLLPWDMDRSYDVPVPVFEVHGVPHWTEPTACEPMPALLGLYVMPPSCDPFLAGLAPLIGDDVVTMRRSLLDGPASLDVLLAEVDRVEALLRPYVEADPHGPTVQEWEAGLADFRSDLRSLDARF
jgi:spore coat protein CotH